MGKKRKAVRAILILAVILSLLTTPVFAAEQTNNPNIPEAASASAPDPELLGLDPINVVNLRI